MFSEESQTPIWECTAETGFCDERCGKQTANNLVDESIIHTAKPIYCLYASNVLVLAYLPYIIIACTRIVTTQYNKALQWAVTSLLLLGMVRVFPAWIIQYIIIVIITTLSLPFSCYLYVPVAFQHNSYLLRHRTISSTRAYSGCLTVYAYRVCKMLLPFFISAYIFHQQIKVYQYMPFIITFRSRILWWVDNKHPRNSANALWFRKYNNVWSHWRPDPRMIVPLNGEENKRWWLSIACETWAKHMRASFVHCSWWQPTYVQFCVLVLCSHLIFVFVLMCPLRKIPLFEVFASPRTNGRTGAQGAPTQNNSIMRLIANKAISFVRLCSPTRHTHTALSHVHDCIWPNS